MRVGEKVGPRWHLHRQGRNGIERFPAESTDLTAPPSTPRPIFDFVGAEPSAESDAAVVEPAGTTTPAPPTPPAETPRTTAYQLPRCTPVVR